MKQQFIVLCMLTVLLTACAPTQTHDTIKIGGLFGLTGISERFGNDERMGAELAIEEINAAGGIHGKQLEFIVEDGQTNVMANRNAYRKLVDTDGIHYIIGPTWTDAAHVIVPLIDADDAILISASSGESEHKLFDNPRFFKTYPPYRDETPTMIKYMELHNNTRVTVVRSAGTFENSMLLGFEDNIIGHNITIVGEQTVTFSDTDFRTVLTKLRQENASAIYLMHGNYAGVGEFFKQSRAMGINVPIYTYSGCEQQSLIDNYGGAVEGMLYPMSAIDKRDEEFRAKFTTRYNVTPATPAAATAYDAVKMLAIGLEQGNDTKSVDEAMHAINDYEGASPITGFTSNGWPVTDRRYVMKTIHEGKFVAVES